MYVRIFPKFAKNYTSIFRILSETYSEFIKKHFWGGYGNFWENKRF